MPDLDALAGSAARALAYLPWWAESLILIVACCAVVMPLHGVVYRAMKRAVSAKSLFWRSLVSRTRGPSRLGLIVVAISLASTTVHLSWEVRIALNQILLVAFVTLDRLVLRHGAPHRDRDLPAAVQARRRGQSPGAQALHADAHPGAGRRDAGGPRHPLGGVDDLRAGAPVRRQPAGLGGRGGPRPRVGHAAGPVEPRGGHPDRHHAADPDRGRDHRRERVGLGGGDHRHLRGGPPLGLASAGPAADLLHPEAVPELDPRRRLADRQRVRLRRPPGARGGDAREARRRSPGPRPCGTDGWSTSRSRTPRNRPSRSGCW